MKILRLRFAAIAGAALALVALAPAYGEELNQAQIEAKLAKPLTRALPTEKQRVAAEFLRSLPSRGLRIDQREKLAATIESEKLPKIEIEVQFEYDSAALKPEAKTSLDELGKALSGNALSGARIALAGHTDAKGEPPYNQSLSEKRAQAVQDYLVARFGIARDRLVATGFGEERPKNKDNPEAAENRRVEIVNIQG